MHLPLLVIGGGGHAKVLIDALLAQHRRVLGFTDPDESRPDILRVARLGGDEVVSRYRPDQVLLVNGIGTTGSSARRREVYYRYRSLGYRFEKVIHPSVVLGAGVVLEEGVQIMAGAVVQTGTRIGANSIVNTRASVDHDCVLAAHVHVGPGATLSGTVRVGEDAFVGAGSTIIQGRTIGECSLIAAGAVVIRDVPANVSVAGVPAREMYVASWVVE